MNTVHVNGVKAFLILAEGLTFVVCAGHLVAGDGVFQICRGLLG